MGFFSGLKAKWKDGSLMNGLQAAGAIASGDYATAAKIRGLYADEREKADEKAKKAQAAQAAVAALVRQGIPEADAVVLVQSGAADTVLAGRYGKESEPAIARNADWWSRATPEQRRAAEEYSSATAGPAAINLPNGGFYYGRPADLPKVLGQGGGRTVTRRGTDASGKRVVQYSDGTIEYEGGGASGGSDTFRNAFAGF